MQSTLHELGLLCYWPIYLSLDVPICSPSMTPMLSFGLDLATFISKTLYFGIEFQGIDASSGINASFNSLWDGYEGKHFVLPHAETPLPHPCPTFLCIAMDLKQIIRYRVYLEKAIDGCPIIQTMDSNALTGITYMERGKWQDPCTARNPDYDVPLGDEKTVYNSRTNRYYCTKTNNEKIQCHYALVDISVMLKVVHDMRESASLISWSFSVRMSYPNNMHPT